VVWELAAVNAETFARPRIAANVEPSVPFFGVTSMEAALRFYVDVGFEMKHKSIVAGRIRGCWVQLGGAS
jgi:hypothetical protein